MAVTEGAWTRPTLEQVAELSGYSRATVSRVVNGTRRVAPEIQQIVQQAIDELHYVPNPAARSLATQRTDCYAFVITEAESRFFSDDEFFPRLIRGLADELERSGKQLILMLAHDQSSHARIEKYALGGHLDGVILGSMHGAYPLPRKLARVGVPVVVSGRPLGEHDVPYVDVDHRSAVREAVEYLIRSGRRSVATIAGPQDMVGGIERLDGYREAVAAATMQPMVVQGDFTRASGAAGMRELLELSPRPDAVFVASDLMAEGAMSVIRDAGLRIPEDIAVIGFDDIELAQFSQPPLTTVHQPVGELGAELARKVMALRAGKDVEQATIVATRFVRRESA
jgi:DNA-binding LacI/PurR family transcriptional regulator